MNHDDIISALKKYFNFDTFLDNQIDIIQSVIDGNDLCVIMPTGAGKSLCYQLPILIKDGYGIVVSPLISLMKDQVDALIAKNIPAAYINSSIPFEQQFQIIRQVQDGMIKILYVAPERFQADSFSQLLHDNAPSILVVDEAHCISQWGHDFRTAYLQLGTVIEQFNIPQICAFTATATPVVRDDIKKQLRRNQMKIYAAGFKRPNLAFKVIETANNEDKNKLLKKILQTPQPTIIYASTRKSVEQIAGELNALMYHAGMSDEERNQTQNEFMSAPCPVLVATNAFGMGIDRSNVRRVIHYNIPSSLEAYYQEAGRAGRDGEPSECILLYSYADRFVHEFLIDLSNPSLLVCDELRLALAKLFQEADSSLLEISAANLAEHVPSLKAEGQINTALNILEKNHYIERQYRNQTNGTLRFIAPLNELYQSHSNKKTQRSIFITRCIDHYGLSLASSCNCTYEELGEITALSLEQLKRVLRALNNEVLIWTPPFAGRSIVLTGDLSVPLNIDEAELNAKRNLEITRLDEVINYAKFKGCRQNYMISYFGEHDQTYRCENCDNCKNQTSSAIQKPVTAGDLEVIRIVLQTIVEFNGRFGSGKISALLCGSKSLDIVGRNFDLHPNFGLLSDIKAAKIMQLLRELEQQQYIHRTDSEYPCLVISEAGRSLLRRQNHSTLELSCLPLRKKTAKTAESPKRISTILEDFQSNQPNSNRKSNSCAIGSSTFAESDDLFELLRELRMKIAARHHCLPYMVLSDATLRELCDKQPLTVEESLTIKGIGPQKAARIMPEIIEAIKKWRHNEFL